MLKRMIWTYRIITKTVLFIPFSDFDFWSLLAKKLQKFENIKKSLFTFCKAREKNGKKITQLKWLKYQKPKDENMG